MTTTAVASLCALPAVALAVALWREQGRRRDAQKAWRATERERDTWFALSPDLFCIADSEGRFAWLSPSWSATLGHTREELLALSWLDLVHPEDRSAAHAGAVRAGQSRQPVASEHRLRCKDGSYRRLAWRACAGADRGMLFAVGRDVTEQRSAEERIRILNAELAARTQQLDFANRELESFSYSVSHDLRAPLRHITGFCGLLQNSVPNSSENGHRFVAIIAKAARQLGSLMDDLLAFSRIGRVPLHRRPVAQDHLIAAIVADGGYDRRTPPIAWQIAPLPEVFCDPPLLRQVWTNLIDNAAKYSAKAAQPRIQIAVTVDPAAGEYVFSVRDNGVGFDMAYADKLFGVFQRLHAPSEFEGTGIGLANVRRIVARHGGRTWAEGRVGEGAAFFFSLPLNSPAVESTP